MSDTDIHQVRAALEVVLGDVRSRGWQPRPALVRADGDWVRPGESSENTVIVSYGGHEFPVDATLEFGEKVALIAERIQDDVIDDVHQGWPMSSDGRRLLSPRTTPSDGSAWWYDREEPIAPIGGTR